MRIYTIHYRRDEPLDGRGLVLVREGFVWLAFLFPVLWALYHRLWLGAVAYLVASIVLSGILAFSGTGEIAQGLAWLALSILAGSIANDWRRWQLRRRGYEEIGVVSGRDRDEAEFRYLSARFGQGSGAGPQPGFG